MSDRPTTVRIQGHEYTIEFVPELAIKDSDKAGVCNSNVQEIKVGAGLAASCQRATLLHEILEGISYQLDLQLEHPMVCRLSAALYQVIADSPEVAKWIADWE